MKSRLRADKMLLWLRLGKDVTLVAPHYPFIVYQKKKILTRPMVRRLPLKYMKYKRQTTGHKIKKCFLSLSHRG